MEYDIVNLFQAEELGENSNLDFQSDVASKVETTIFA
jgi:hypothetical protein